MTRKAAPAAKKKPAPKLKKSNSSRSKAGKSPTLRAFTVKDIKYFLKFIGSTDEAIEKAAQEIVQKAEGAKLNSKTNVKPQPIVIAKRRPPSRSKSSSKKKVSSTPNK